MGNKMPVILSVTLIAVFLIIVIVTQSNSTNKPVKAVASLPPEADTFQPISPSMQQQQQVQGRKQGPQPTFGVEEGVRASYSGTIKTTKGDIQIYLSGRDAPRTVKNFLTKAQSGYYKNLTFHRVEDWVVQGGDPKGNGTGGNLMQTELNTLQFVAGSLGVARGSDIRVSNDSQFFIVKQDSPHLDRQYTNFGIVTNGMDVVNKITVGDKILGITITK